MKRKTQEKYDSYVKSMAIVSNVATDLGEDFSLQGIEKLLDGINPVKDDSYTLILLGEALDNKSLTKKKDEIFSAYSSLSPYAERQEDWSLGEAKERGGNLNLSVGVNIPSKKVGFHPSLGGGFTWGSSYNANKGGSVDIM